MTVDDIGSPLDRRDPERTRSAALHTPEEPLDPERLRTIRGRFREQYYDLHRVHVVIARGVLSDLRRTPIHDPQPLSPRAGT